MPNVQKASFALDAAIGGAFGFASSTIGLPGTLAGDTIVRVVNQGPCHIAVKLVTTSGATINQSTGLVIPAGQTEYLTLSAGELFLAGCACGGPGNTSIVNIATGN